MHKIQTKPRVDGLADFTLALEELGIVRAEFVRRKTVVDRLQIDDGVFSRNQLLHHPGSVALLEGGPLKFGKRRLARTFARA